MSPTPLEVLRHLNLNHLLAFLAVAEAGSFRSAAARMYITQSALSMQVRQLEDVFGVPVFHRTTRSLSLTGEGKRLLPVVRRLTEDIAQITTELREEGQLQRGVTTLVALPSLATTLLPQILREFGALHPGIQVRLRDADSKTAFDLVLRGEVDMGLLSRGEDQGDLSFTPLFADELFAVVPAQGHPLSQRRRIVMQDLKPYPLLLNPRGVALREMLEHKLQSVGIKPAPVQELVSTYALVALVGAGLGVSVLPRMAVARADLLGCRTLTIQDGGARDIGLVLYRRRSISPAAEALRAFIRSTLPATLQSK